MSNKSFQTGVSTAGLSNLHVRCTLIVGLLICSVLSECFLIESAFKLVFYLLSAVWMAIELRNYVRARNSLAKSSELRVYLMLLSCVLLSLLLSLVNFAYTEKYSVFDIFLRNSLIIISSFSLMSLGLPDLRQARRASFLSAELLDRLNQRMLQPLALLMGCLPILITLCSLSFSISYDGVCAYRFGVSEYRLWGCMNPNIEALFYSFVAYFAYLSFMRLAVYAPEKRFSKQGIYLLICVFFQLFFCFVQQSRGAAALVICLLIGLALIHGKTVLQRLCLLAFTGFICFVYGCLVLGFNHALSAYISQTEFTHYNLELSINQQDVLQEEVPEAPSSVQEAQSAQSVGKSALVKQKNKEVLDASSYGAELLETRLDKRGSTGRTLLWEGGWLMFTAHPILGVSPEGMQLSYPQYFSQEQIDNSLTGGGVHNLYLTMLISLGLVGSLVFIVCFLYLARKLLLQAKQAYQARELAEKRFEFYLYASWIVLYTALLLHGSIESILLFRINCIAVWFWFITLRLAFRNSHS